MRADAQGYFSNLEILLRILSATNARLDKNVLFQGSLVRKVTNITFLGIIIGPNCRVLRGYFQNTNGDFMSARLPYQSDCSGPRNVA